MEKEQIFQRNAGFLAFFLSGICAISSGVVVSMLQETYGFKAYGMTGTLLSLMSIGNLLASGFASGMLPAKIGTETPWIAPDGRLWSRISDHGIFPGWIAGFLMLAPFPGGRCQRKHHQHLHFHPRWLITPRRPHKGHERIMHSLAAPGRAFCAPFFIGAAMKAVEVPFPCGVGCLRSHCKADLLCDSRRNKAAMKEATGT
ncbi:MAG: hypothetical protein ACLTW9_29690 [Enterocloster sp.]